jgi:hypothetical protein
VYCKFAEANEVTKFLWQNTTYQHNVIVYTRDYKLFSKIDIAG